MTILEQFEKCNKENTFLKIQAPMVRYSKLPFRLLCLKYSTDIVYTPMILCNSFSSSEICRQNEFQTCKEEKGKLVVQFAANNAVELAKSAQLIEPFCDAIDLNCGCPQRWAIQEGIGSGLLWKPDLIADMIKMKRNTCSDSFPMAIKIRIHPEDDWLHSSNWEQEMQFRKTIDLVHQIEKAGASWITVHGRTYKHKSNSTPVNWKAIQLIKQNATVPIVFNGDVFSLDDAQDFYEKTKVDGVMSARGILSNPTLFDANTALRFQQEEPLEVIKDCVSDFLDIITRTSNYHTTLPFASILNHCMFMLEPYFSKYQMVAFQNEVTSFASLVQFLEMNW